ncbi:MAG: hypothetical protein IPK82_13315 [Polyangiaceae bacterium]|nr:hypothetical protein [Polyangiaceae bacterium]
MRSRLPLFSKTVSIALAASFATAQSGCVISSAEVVNTDKVYLLGPQTESEPGAATREVTTKAVDTRGTIAFHVNRARQCTITSTPRYQKVHIEGREGKNVAGGIITGAVLVAAAAGLLAGSFIVDNGQWAVDSTSSTNSKDFTGGGIMGLTGIILGISGLVILPRGIYHAAVSGKKVTGGEVEVGTPPPGAVRAPQGYDPKNPSIGALLPRAEQPRYGVLDFGFAPAGQSHTPVFVPVRARATAEPVESLRSASAFDAVVNEGNDSCDPSLLAMPQSSGGGASASDQMRACVAKYTPECQKKCKDDRSCVLSCLRRPCIENLDQEVASGTLKEDEYTTVITRTESCEQSSDAGVGIAVVVKDLDGVPKTIEVGKTDKNGNVQKDLLAGLESTYPGWPEVKQVILNEAQIVLIEDPSVALGTLDLNKYPGLKYAEHVQSTKKAREALAAAEAARKEKEAKERQAMLEAAAKAQDDAAHADERKAEAAKKAAACVQQAQSRCNADCQGNAACAKKCMQKVSCK